ncbi:unnamed protein product [Didymodactylos carnosus]|uniref:RNA-directed DNA polymerase from mobile element jockey n=1 Tax=Didymodactylos carnosus TaxID=1234261 RepID=A0A814WNC1_9BILA|nr:unnamed protein product [Didymodactylos carnosus]CAF3968958.1 unnamed protein product [Didymodactylos carnosus]
MIDHAYAYYSHCFKQREVNYLSPTDVRVNNYIKNFDNHLNEQPSKSFLFTMNDFRWAIRSLKAKQSSGPDKVSNKTIKLLPQSHYSFILVAFNKLLTTNLYPSHWKTAKMLLLPKEKASLISIENTRSISLISCFGKVFEKCMLLHQKVNDRKQYTPR